MATTSAPPVHDDEPDRARPRSGPSREESMTRLWLYDADGNDAPVGHDYSSLPEPGDREMLWADVDLGFVDRLDRLWEKLKVGDIVPHLTDAGEGPGLVQHDGLVHVRVTALDSESDPVTLHCLVGENWVVTLHQGNLELVDEFNKPFHGDTTIGELDGPSFLSMVLEWQISGYFEAIEEVQSDIDRLDEELLTRFPDEDGLLPRLQRLRRRVRELRRALGAHRPVFELLGHPESGSVLGPESSSGYQRLDDRLQQGMDALETTRDMIVGSFDIFMSRTGQATNEIMKRLTTISILLLPAVVIAGIMGMNFRVWIFDRPWMFWVVLGLMVTFAVLTLLVAKRQKWL